MVGIRPRQVLAATVAASAVLAALVVPARPAEAGGEFPPAIDAQLEALTESLVQLHAPGALLGVSVGGQGRFLGVAGVAGVDDATPLDPAMHLRIGSITKTVTATAVLQLVDRCLLGLDDTIDRWQPGVRGADVITVRDLLGMRSGIHDYAETAEFNTVFSSDPLFEWEPQQLIDIVAHRDPMFPAGSAHFYSNTNYIILGLIVESITGQPLEQVIEERVLQPLGLLNTSFPTTPAIPSPAAPGGSVVIDPNGDLVSEMPFNMNPSAAWAAGAMISTIGDLELWARALVAGTLLSPGVQAERLQLEPTVGPGNPQGISFPSFPAFPGPTLASLYGLGLFTIGGYIGHNGSVPSHEAIMVFDPNTETLIVEMQTAEVAEQGDVDHKVVDFPGVLPALTVPSVAGILGQDPPLPPNPSNAGVPHCAPAQPAPLARAPAPILATPTFTG